MRLVFPGISYSKPGGTENLIAQIIKTAQIEHDVVSIIIGTKDSYLIKKLITEEVPFVFLPSQEVDGFEFQETDLWVHTHNSTTLRAVKRKPGKAVVWCVLVNSLIDWNRFRFEVKLTGRKLLGNFITRRLIHGLIKRDALLAMDGATADSICGFLGRKSKIPLLPVAMATDDAPLKCEFNRVRNTRHVVSYIGRSDDVWKIKPAKKILLDLKHLDQKFLVNIYTDHEAPFDRELSSIVNYNVEVRYHIGMSGRKLREHLAANSDIHFSMGMSALEGALCQIPTVLVDPSFIDLPEHYQYRWLYQTELFSLGRFIDSGGSDCPGMQMREILEVLESPESACYVAEKSRQYVLQNHSPSYITKLLISVNSCASNTDISRLTPSSWG